MTRSCSTFSTTGEAGTELMYAKPGGGVQVFSNAQSRHLFSDVGSHGDVVDAVQRLEKTMVKILPELGGITIHGSTDVAGDIERKQRARATCRVDCTDAMTESWSWVDADGAETVVSTH